VGWQFAINIVELEKLEAINRGLTLYNKYCRIRKVRGDYPGASTLE